MLPPSALFTVDSFPLNGCAEGTTTLNKTTHRIMTLTTKIFSITSILTLSIMDLIAKFRINDIQRNNTQYNHIKHNNTQHSGIKHNNTQHNGTKHNDTQHKHIVSLSCGTHFCTVKLSVVMLNVLAPCRGLFVGFLKIVVFTLSK